LPKAICISGIYLVGSFYELVIINWTGVLKSHFSSQAAPKGVDVLVTKSLQKFTLLSSAEWTIRLFPCLRFIRHAVKPPGLAGGYKASEL
jgi:hypothetical protein